MPPDLPNDQELSLKKRARRRLVGAIGLVLIMVIILPMILQDRADLAPKNAIKITMPEPIDADSAKVLAASVDVLATPILPDAPNVALSTEVVNVAPINTEDKKIEAVVAKKTEKKTEIKSELKQVATEKALPKTEPKPIERKISEVKSIEAKPDATKAQQKNGGSFAIQVGVYSDPANVKQLQVKLKEAGFTSRTENISTPKGDKIRLRAGKFPSRQATADALDKLKASGLPGMVISND
jgi:DedD protein